MSRYGFYATVAGVVFGTFVGQWLGLDIFATCLTAALYGALTGISIEIVYEDIRER